MALKVPTPIHGWRVFAGEVGVIVLGVLIALGAQEVAEHYSERERAKVALSAIRAEIHELNFFAAERLARRQSPLHPPQPRCAG